jgi:hypothetical protein
MADTSVSEGMVSNTGFIDRRLLPFASDSDSVAKTGK